MTTIKKYVASRKFLAHLIMMAFALASLNNIRRVIYTLKGDLFSAWAAGIALGLALVVMAAILSETKWRPGERRFTTILGVTGLLTLLSGLVQGYGFYQQVGLIGVLFGLMFPALGELGIALALSAYTEILESRNIEDAQRQLALGVQAAISDAIQEIDPTKIQKQVATAASKISSEIVSATVDDMITEIRAQRKIPPAISNPEISLAPEITGQISELDASHLPKANEARSEKKQQRQQRISTIVAEHGPVSVAEISALLNKEVTERTIGSDLRELAAEKQVISRHRKWQVRLPQAMATNGASA